jgi:hypothetical protein
VGVNNTATGLRALANNNASRNTATGVQALLNNTMGFNNTASGVNALSSNTTGDDNTASGVDALSENTTGNNNTATGFQALLNNNTGGSNTANGVNALRDNTTGVNNTAVGAAALRNSTTGGNNTANGESSLANNTTGGGNTATGVRALENNTMGNTNVATGYHALQHNTTGTSNIALGVNAGINLTTGDNNIDIGYNVSGPAGESNTIRIGDPFVQGATYIAGIHGAVVPGGAPVVVDTSGHLGTIVSSQRFKDEIKPMNEVSEAIFALEPVTFRYKRELDPQGIPQFGLVAERVAKVDPDLVVCDKEGKPYAVRYEQINAMLLNEFLKEHKRVEKLEATVADLAAQLQKISAQVEMNTPAMRVTAENR